MEGITELMIHISAMGATTKAGAASAKNTKPEASLTPTPPRREGTKDLKKKIQPIPKKSFKGEISDKKSCKSR